jgi:5'-nucleotidase
MSVPKFLAETTLASPPPALFPLAPAAAPCGHLRMKFLVTNDDGIASVFLHELVRALLADGHEVSVAAPKREQSWIGAAKSRHRPVTSERIDCRAGVPDPAAEARNPAGSGDPALQPEPNYNLGCPTWIVDGTPSDCVNIALAHLLPGAGLAQPDAVVSGINIGFNASLAFILASGTIGGAWEGAVHGLPGIAVSQDVNPEAFERLRATGGKADDALLAVLKISSRHAARLAASLAASTAPRSFTVHNLNFPASCAPETEVRHTVPARVIIPGLFSPAEDDGTHRFVFNRGEDISPVEPLTDRAAISAGFISHTILDYRKLGT